MNNTRERSRKSAVPIPQAANDAAGDHEHANPAGIDFHGASVINEHGEEVPITESMIQNACNTYIQQWEVAQKNHPGD